MPARRFRFLAKLAAIAALVALADRLFWRAEVGATLGAFALGWTLLLAIVVPAVRRPAPAVALLAAAGCALILIDDPDPIAWALFWGATGSAALLTRTRFDDAARWAVRLAVHGFASGVRPLLDLQLLARRGPAGRARRLAALLALPVVGGAAFVLLFAAANPVIGAVIGRLALPSPLRAIFWTIAAGLVWPSFRPLLVRLPPGGTGLRAPRLPVATLLLSLVVFNAIFAVENVLDLAILWSGAPLPDGVTLADYAHRGAYLLIVTALLAGGFVLLACRPDVAARARMVRPLVVLWIAQNLLLLASSARRTLAYVAEYQMTELRLAALVWMALVGIGLVLIGWRLLHGRSARWLLNANALAAAVGLAACSATDLGAIAAHWNVRAARDGDRLDLCYLQRLGPAAILPLIELERRAGGPVLAERARWLRRGALHRLRMQQADWHQWTWRGARRLARADALLGPPPHAVPAWRPRACGGAPLPAHPARPRADTVPASAGAPVVATPLTKAPR